jgi:uncharacterized pyridoxamine 5'-phosphate oxidase family protein
MQEVYDFLKKAGAYYIAATGGDQTRVRPFSTIDLLDGKLYIQTGKVKDVAKQIKVNPKIEICAFDGGNCIRVQANAVEDPRREAKVRMLEAYPMLRIGLQSPEIKAVFPNRHRPG